MILAGNQVGPYTLISKLGCGAYGIVWLAERRTTITTTQVAVKLPLNDEFDIEVIRREANLWVQASGHPNVLPIIEANIYQGQIVIVSEYAPDGSLSNWLKTHNDISLETAIEMTSGILAGLEHLHSKKIIHRDLKPDNILLQGEVPRLADFGIAQILRSNTESSMVAGTPAYMPPESFFGNHNLQADLWAVAVIFYRLLAGKLPFPQTKLPLLIRAILENRFDPLPTYIPSAIQDFIIKALLKEPQDRYQSVDEMRKALKQAYKKSIRTSTTSLKPSLSQCDIAITKIESIFALDRTQPLYPNLPAPSVEDTLIDNSIDDLLDSSLDISLNSISNKPINKYLTTPLNNLSDTLSNEDKKYNITNYSLPAFVTLETSSIEQAMPNDRLQKTLKEQVVQPISNSVNNPVNNSVKILQKQISKQNINTFYLFSFFTPKYQKVIKATSHLSDLATHISKFSKTIPKRVYLASFIVIAIGLCMLQKNLVAKAYDNFSSSLRLNSLNIIQNLSPASVEVKPVNEATVTDTPILVEQALSEVNDMIARVERELPPEDPTKSSNLVRFNGFRYGLKDYYIGNISAEQARQYAESALSQTKSVHLQLDKKKKNALNTTAYKPRETSKPLLKKASQ